MTEHRRKMGKVHFAKKPFRSKASRGGKLDFSERCDQCNEDLSVCRVRSVDNAEKVIGGSGLAVIEDGEAYFFCDKECQHAFIEMPF
jgi:hypothetical protein